MPDIKTPSQLKKWMKQRTLIKQGVTASELARAIGFTSRYVGMILKGERPITAEFLKRLDDLK